MQMIILAAGKGTRLMPYTRDVPKCLVSVADGRTLLDLQLSEIEASGGVDRVTVVAGYRAELVTAELSARRSSVAIEVVVNGDYDRTNALHSLWLALQRQPDEFLVLNGDTFVRGSTLRRLLAAPHWHEAAIAFSSASEFSSDAVKVVVEEGRLRAIGKELDEDRASGESVGLARFVGRRAARACETTEALVRHAGGSTAYWYTLIRHMISSGAIHAVDCPADDWFEVDRPEDLERARLALAPA